MSVSSHKSTKASSGSVSSSFSQSFQRKVTDGFRGAFSSSLRKSAPASESSLKLERLKIKSQTLVEISRCEMLTNNQSCILCFKAFIHIRAGEDKLRVIQYLENFGMSGTNNEKETVRENLDKCKQHGSRKRRSRTDSNLKGSHNLAIDCPSHSILGEGDDGENLGSKANQHSNNFANTVINMGPQTPRKNVRKQRSKSQVTESTSSPQAPDIHKNDEKPRSNSQLPSSNSVSIPASTPQHQTSSTFRRLRLERMFEHLSLSKGVTTVTFIDISDIRWCYLVYTEKSDQPGLNMRSTILGITTTNPNRMFRFVINNLEERALLVETICHRRDLYKSKNNKPIELMHVDSTVLDKMFGSEIFDYDSDEVTLYSSDEDATDNEIRQ